MIYKLLYVFFMGFWRDAFGKNGYDLPVFKIRFVQHVIAFLMTAALCFLVKGFAWYAALWVAVWIQVEWALGHGACYDIGKGGKPDAKMKKRYEKMLGCKLLYKLFPENEWYSTGFDFCLLSIRYTYPLIPICVCFNPTFMSLGLFIAGLYAIYRACPYCKKHRLLDVEIWAGLALGLFVAFL